MSALTGIIRRAKHWLVPKDRVFRKVLFGPAAGCWMLIDLHHEMRLYLGVYERELWPSYRELLRPGMKSFDIGGRDGYSALLLAKSTGADVVSFECEPAGIAEMTRIFDRNGLPIRAVQAFVGAPGDAATTMTVDSAAANYFLPDFLKIDVEGGEAAVLRGAEKILSSRRPAMIVETHGAAVERECLSILERHRYTVTIVDRTTFLPEQRPLEHNRWLVCKPPMAEPQR
jgi:hypothetical protein